MLSRADSINSVVLIEEYTARLACENESKQLHALHLIKHEIYSILQKTKDPTAGIIRLKWWHDEIIKSRNNGFATLNAEFELIQNYLSNVSEMHLKEIADWIVSYEPMVTRKKFKDLLREYLIPNANAYQTVLKDIFNCKIGNTVSLMVAINDFLDYMEFFFNYNWYWAENEIDFNRQLTMVWSELDRISGEEKIIKIDKKIKFLFQSHDWLISRYRKYRKWDIRTLPKLNLGIMRMSLAMLALNK